MSDDMTNLLQETIECLKEHGKTFDDVIWVGSRDGEFSIPPAEFIRISDIEYDSGFGAQEIADDLVIVGVDFWLERHEYDGSEWWEFKTVPQRKLGFKPFSNIGGGSDDLWRSLSDLNKVQDSVDGGSKP